jgi:hypothetical protein
MTQIKTLGWRRLGIVVSIIWFFGWACFYFWISRNEGSYSDEYSEYCNSSSNEQTQALQQIETTKDNRAKIQAKILAAHEKCQRQADALFWRQRAMAKKDARWVLAVDFFSVLFGWFFVWSMISFVRCMIGISRWLKQRLT